MERITYRVDEHDRIIEISDNWDAFARNNQAPDMTTDQVLGRPLFDFVTNRENQYLYRILMQRVRSAQYPISFPFRCDAPDLRRFMHMEIRPMAGEDLLFCSSIIRTEERASVRLLDIGVQRSPEVLIMCSWCKKIHLQDSDNWVDAEEATKQLHLFEADIMPSLSHLICPDCATLNFLRD